MADLSLKTPSKLTNSKKSSKVRVIVRVRPFLDREISPKDGQFPNPCVSALDADQEEVSVHLEDRETRRNECYKLDAFFGQDERSVAQIFEKEVKPLIPGVFEGFNATVFAYGATGSGKTYTMQGTDEQPGLMVQAMSGILSICKSKGYTVEVSYYEVYLEKCFDLLELKAKEFSILEDKDGHLHLRGLSRKPISSMEEFREVLSLGIQRRKTAHTGLNDASSRSHGVLVIAVSSCPTNVASATIYGKLNLIDLAGNEDNRGTCNEGIRFQEGTKINQSLFALSNVIYALNNNQPRVPYRESKLTRILQDSLGGTSRALMVACLNPGAYQESVRTVSLAARSRQITNFAPSGSKHETPKVRVDMEAKLRDWLESRGKTKSVHGMRAFGSPAFGRTPRTVGCSRRQTGVHGSAVSMSNMNSGASTRNERLKASSQRKLFSCDTALDSCTNFLSKVVLKKVDILHGLSLASLEPGVSLATTSLSIKIWENDPKIRENDNHPGAQVGYSVVPESVCMSSSSVPPNSDYSEICSSEVNQQVEESEKGKDHAPSKPPSKSQACSPDKEAQEEGERVPSQAPSPPRKALSTIDLNISRDPLDEILKGEQAQSSWLLETTPPKTPFVVTRKKFQHFRSALDKLNSRGSNLKGCLLDEYIDFLNTATREELVAVKGIGPKRADYIVELRESSPLKSLSDLKKIGLSSKQVQNLFGSAARGIFS